MYTSLLAEITYHSVIFVDVLHNVVMDITLLVIYTKYGIHYVLWSMVYVVHNTYNINIHNVVNIQFHVYIHTTLHSNHHIVYTIYIINCITQCNTRDKIDFFVLDVNSPQSDVESKAWYLLYSQFFVLVHTGTSLSCTSYHHYYIIYCTITTIHCIRL